MMLSSSQPLLHADFVDPIQLSIQKDQGAKRQVNVQMLIPHSIEQVWDCITNYDRLVEVIPNLAHCHQVSQVGLHKRVEMVGYCQILQIKFSLRFVLDVLESPPHRIETQLIEGDLRAYQGVWQLEEIRDRVTMLSYSAEIVPKLGMPIRLLERQAQVLLPHNFSAIRQYLDQAHRYSAEV